LSENTQIDLANMAIPKPFSDQVLRSMLSKLSGRESFVFLESARVTPENHFSYLFSDSLERIVCNPEDDPAVFFSRAQEKLAQGFFLAGYVGYEFGYLLEPSLAKKFRMRTALPNAPGMLPLADLGVFDRPRIYDHQEESMRGKGCWPAETGTEGETGFSVNNLRLNLKREEYLKAIRRIKSYIAAGDTYQVNYTLKILFDFSGAVSDFYRTLRRNQHVCYGGLIKNGGTTILTFSPELFFRKKNNTINVRPMKGTMSRGRTISEDMRFADLLHHDIKNRSENVMIVDLLRNDLGRLSRMGGVSVQSLFDVETYETLHQMTSSIRGEVNRQVSLEETFKALFPCGSVTGAPKIRTMEIIRELEAADRGVYTGAIGFLSPEGEAVFNVPIRTIVLQGNKGEMGIGSGIVWDSDPIGEWEECKLKGRFLTAPAPEFKLIETLLWNDASGYWLLDLHLDRLAESARYFSYPLEDREVRIALQEIAATFHSATSVKNQRVRVALAKTGVFEITHSPLADKSQIEIDPAAIMQQTPGKDLPRVLFSGINVDSSSAFLFHKTTWRKLFDHERTRVVDEMGYYEVFFVNERGEVTEGSYTNIFMQKDGRLLTPPVSCGLLPGVLRRHLLQQYPDLVVESKFTRTDLERADAVFAGNSVRGLVRVSLEVTNTCSGRHRQTL
jgi:para-aminobenzoate synthetase/4-amino-4-deoxychorismate lyase